MIIELFNIKNPVKGVIHIGAHECEERNSYIRQFGLSDDNILWFEALEEKVNLMKSRNPNIKIHNECLSNCDNKLVTFMITNNFMSSSMLNFKTHLQEHPEVHETHRVAVTTKRLDTFFRENNLNISDYNFMNLDVQGAELMVLQGCGNLLDNIDYIYTEVNEKELYEGCCLLPELDEFLKSKGFVRFKTEMTRHGWGEAFYHKV